ncbi:MAG TPA: DUF3185 family protein [Candidatus Omnitrophica bacterium]|nr:DUF3185 family protein [Candidatus Omnitrophota bacterium]
MKKSIGIFMLFVSMVLFYWGYHESQLIDEPVAGLLQKDNGTRHIVYINLVAIVVLLVGGYFSMDDWSKIDN